MCNRSRNRHDIRDQEAKSLWGFVDRNLSNLREGKRKDEKLKPYQEYLENLIKSFDETTFEYLPRDNNRFVNALATLVSMVECTPDTKVHPFLVDRRHGPTYKESVNALTTDGRSWSVPIIDFIRERKYEFHSQ
ncbi:uncharacterized protein LOC122655267 [Telopea speciosissima]|uniref:uncharacterized protein LOC122655267 n=1 Tax=Telopea speciosissima TaxID=54955 RepID=UPI001CC5AC7E|nr:uncharacterized protein LOC122655267 [Telopea speciosissima]